MSAPWAELHLDDSPPRVSFPRPYNAAADLVDRHLAAGRGDRIAYRDDRGTCTYADLAERVGRAGGALAGLGVQPEQRVDAGHARHRSTSRRCSSAR